MGRLTGVVVATPDPQRFNLLVAELDPGGERSFEIDVVEAAEPSPAMSLCVVTDELEADTERCAAAGYAEAWRATGRQGESFVMAAEPGGAAILLVAR